MTRIHVKIKNIALSTCPPWPIPVPHSLSYYYLCLCLCLSSPLPVSTSARWYASVRTLRARLGHTHTLASLHDLVNQQLVGQNSDKAMNCFLTV